MTTKPTSKLTCCCCAQPVRTGLIVPGISKTSRAYHHHCFLETGGDIHTLPAWQVERFPWKLLLDKKLLERAVLITGHSAGITEDDYT